MSTRDLPRLSGPPPEPSGHETACRKCNKEFNILFARGKKCNHCGYSYCTTCTGYTALMPRGRSGYDTVPVCAFCIDNLTITAGSRNYMKSLSLSKLKKYADAYNLQLGQIIEKDELVNKLMSFRDRKSGCLPLENEDYYRKHSVPNNAIPRSRGLFTRQAPPVPAPVPASRPQPPRSDFPRPDIQPRWQPPPPSTPRPTIIPQTQPQPQYNTRPQSFSRQSNLEVPQPNHSTRPRTASHGATTQPPPPTLDELLTMLPEDIRSLRVSTLKEILYHNHVNARTLIEKPELVERVTSLIDDERRCRQIEQEQEREQERLGRMHTETDTPTEPLVGFHPDSEQQTPNVAFEQITEPHLDQRPEVAGSNDDDQQIPTVSADDVAPSEQQTTTDTTTAPQLTSGLNDRSAMATNLERNGLCVICQDEEANIAIIDCGHLAMCRTCSEKVMSTSQECPLCRNRIVTESRLLRIFKS